MRLRNKVAIITGAASGFGKGISKKFTEEGAKLVMVDINSKLLKKVSKSLSQDFFISNLERYSSRTYFKSSKFSSCSKFLTRYCSKSSKLLFFINHFF